MIPTSQVADLLGHVDMTILVETYRHRTTGTVSGHIDAMNVTLGTGDS